MEHRGQAQLSTEEQLFLGLAEQLARPFLQISRQAELARTDDAVASAARWRTIEAITQSSLQLVESYALSLRLHAKVTPLDFQPITVSSLLYDAAQILEPFAKQYGVELELQPGPRVQPIIADRTVLQSAMVSLGQVFVLAGAESETKPVVRLAAHRGRYGIVTGLYGNTPHLGADSLRRAHALQGKAREPLQRLVSGPAAGVFVADSLLQTLSSKLHVARYRSLTGLAATLQSSEQLQMV